MPLFAVNTDRPSVPTVDAFRQMDPIARQMYLDGISDPVTRDQAYANFKAASQADTLDFLQAARSRLYPLVAPGGNSQVTATYAQNSTILLDVPTVSGAVGESIFLQFDITFTYTPAGSGPYVNLNAAGWDALLEEITLQYGAGGIQHRAHPYFYRVIETWVRGYQKTDGVRLFTPSSGPIHSDTWLDNQLYNSPSIASGSNTVRLIMRIDFNPMHDAAPEGLLSFAGGNTAQLIMRSGTLAGPDPLLNCVSTNGTISAVTGTVQAFLEYRDGRTLSTPRYLTGPDLAGIDTYQTRMNAVKNITNANQLTSDRFTPEGRHYYVFALVIDGVQSTQFALRQNITGVQLTSDEVGSSQLEAWGLNTRSPMWGYWLLRMRRPFGQNFPQGLIPHVIATSMLETDPDDRLGTDVLNMSQGGYSSVYQQIALGAISTANGIQPRLVTFFGSVTRPFQIVG